MSMAEDFINIFYGEDDFTNFGAQLLRLIGKADRENLERLKKSFPAEVELYEWWMEQTNPPVPEEVNKKAEEIYAEHRMWP